jgi:hypothetical protein
MPANNYFRKKSIASAGSPTANVGSQTAVRAWKVPSPLPIPDIEGIKDADPGIASALSGLQAGQEALAAYLTRIEGPVGQKPRPPLEATVTLGFAPNPHIVLTWKPDSQSETSVEYYKVYRASGGNTFSPNRPHVLDGDFIFPVFAQDRAYLVNESAYSVVDDTVSYQAFIFPGSPSSYYYWVSSVDRFGRESHAVACDGSPLTLVPDVTQNLQFYQPGTSLNLLYNPKFIADNGAVALLDTRTVTGATNAAPISITTSANHNLTNGDRVLIRGVTGNSAANGYWSITTFGGTTFTLNGSSGNGAYSAGGTVYRSSDQPPPMGPKDNTGQYAKSLWYLISGTAPTFVTSAGNIGSGLKSLSGDTCAIGQDIFTNTILWAGFAGGPAPIFVTMQITTDSGSPASSGTVKVELDGASGWSTATWTLVNMSEVIPNYVGFPLYGNSVDLNNDFTLKITIANPGCNVIISDVMMTVGYQPKPFTEVEEPNYAGLGQGVYSQFAYADSSIGPPF